MSPNIRCTFEREEDLEMRKWSPLASLKTFLTSEDGPAAVEYAVMLALIIVACISVLIQHGQCVSSVFSRCNVALAGS
jgi:pilus assembly protein Flp/PilA